LIENAHHQLSPGIISRLRFVLVLAESVLGDSTLGRQPECVGAMDVLSLGTINALKAAAGASTPEYLVTLNLGGGTSAASRSISSIGS
jgi:hypothetical protein